MQFIILSTKLFYIRKKSRKQQEKNLKKLRSITEIILFYIDFHHINVNQGGQTNKRIDGRLTSNLHAPLVFFLFFEFSRWIWCINDENWSKTL